MLARRASTADPPAHFRREHVALIATVACLVAFHWLAYGDFVGRFFAFDDFFVLGQVNRFRIRSPLDLWHFFEPQIGFLLYRPFTTVGYFWLQRAVWGLDPRGWMISHLGVHLLNALLVGLIARRLVGSRTSVLVAALAYASVPGHTLAARWFAFFTITGTVLAYFLGLWVWLSVRPSWRVRATFAVFVVALLCSEHAVSFPLALTVVAVIAQRRSIGQTLRELAPFYVVSAIYVAAKIVYINVIFPHVSPVEAAFFGPMYKLSFAPAAVLERFGRYATGSISVLFTANVGQQGYRVLGGAVLVLAAITSAGALRRDAGRSLCAVACGLDLFVIGLGPVILLNRGVYLSYLGIPALGVALAIVGATCGSRRREALALLIVAVLAYHDLREAGPLARRGSQFLYVDTSGKMAASWLETLRRTAERTPNVREFIVPFDGFSKRLFIQGEAHRMFLCAPYDVRPVPHPTAQPQAPGRVVVLRPEPIPAGLETDGWRALRRCPG